MKKSPKSPSDFLTNSLDGSERNVELSHCSATGLTVFKSIFSVAGLEDDVCGLTMLDSIHTGELPNTNERENGVRPYNKKQTKKTGINYIHDVVLLFIQQLRLDMLPTK